MNRCNGTAWALLATAWCGGSVASAIPTTSLVQNPTAPTFGADIDTFQRGVRHFTFDVRASTNADWVGSETRIDVVNPALGRIWHASDQRFGYRDLTPSDPNDPLCYVHNLAAPGIERNDITRFNTRMFDTFFTRPGQRFVLDPIFASPGLPPTPEQPCPAQVVSTDARIRGLNPSGVEIPLTWYDYVSMPPLYDQVLARLTFEIEPSAFPQPGYLAVNPSGAGQVLFAVVDVRTSEDIGNDFPLERFEIWWVPEPATLPLLVIGAFAVLGRRAGR
ncbi:MAG: PEP-CTERM sorting domain-containing protein [Phycisphaerae bacterium]